MKKIILCLVFIGALAAAVWWLRKPAASPDAEEASATAQVSVAPIQSLPISRRLEAYGTVEAPDQGSHAVTLSYDCVVRSVTVAVGSRVSMGIPLLSVDPTPDAKLQLDSARSVAAQAGRSLTSARQRFDLKLGTQDDLRVAEQASEDASLRVSSLEGRGLGGGEHTISSPSDGIVIKLDAVPGATVPAGTPLAVVASIRLLSARIGIEPSDAALVKAGQNVTLVSVSRPNASPVTGAVGAVGGVADSATGSLDIRIPLAAGDSWLPGERVEAQIEVERKTALVAPSSAVLSEDGKDVVYTVKDGKAVKHVVTVGIRSEGKVEVSAPGLGAGDPVVIQGNYELSDGMEVSLAETAARGETPQQEDKGR